VTTHRLEYCSQVLGVLPISYLKKKKRVRTEHDEQKGLLARRSAYPHIYHLVVGEEGHGRKTSGRKYFRNDFSTSRGRYSNQFLLTVRNFDDAREMYDGLTGDKLRKVARNRFFLNK